MFTKKKKVIKKSHLIWEKIENAGWLKILNFEIITELQR